MASTAWLDRLNLWRQSTGLPALTENTTWSAGDYAHAVYMVKNNLVTHYETAGTPYYSAAGDTAARNSNIYVSSTTTSTDTQAIDWWMQAPFHALGLMDPRLTTTAFGSYREVKSGWQMGAAVDVLRGNPFSGGQYPVFFPGNGSSVPLTSYGGHESPDPLQACSGYTAPTGLPVFVQVGGNVATTVGAVHSFTGNGVALAHCVIDSSNASLGSSLKSRGAVVLIPRAPLQTGVTYTVALTVNGVPRTWSFTVGNFAPALPACASAGLSSSPSSPAMTGAVVTLNPSATNCPNPLYQFWLRLPNGTWQLAHAYASGSWSWDTAGLPAGTYTISLWAKDTASTGINGNANGRYDTYRAFTYVLSAGCPSIAASASPPTAARGTTVTLTAAARGCASTTPQYQFWVLYPGTTTWRKVQPYSASATLSWNTTGLAAGTYRFSVWVKNSSAAGTQTNTLGSYDAYAALSYQLT